MLNYKYWLLAIVIFSGCSHKVNYDPKPITSRAKVSKRFKKKTSINENPFQVVYADNVSNIYTGLPLKRLSKLSINDTIKIENSGHIIMAHFTGLFLEFEKDTTLVIAQLANKIKQRMGFNPELTKQRFIIDQLFQNENLKKRVSAIGAVSRPWPSYLKFVLPYSDHNSSIVNQQVCLIWENTDPEYKSASYDLAVKSMFNDVLDKISTKGKYLNMDLSKYANKESLYIIRLSAPNDEQQNDTVILSNNENPVYSPTYCEAKTALEALELACHLEMGYGYKTSIKYYELAAQLSDKPIFNEILNHARQRFSKFN